MGSSTPLSLSFVLDVCVDLIVLVAHCEPPPSSLNQHASMVDCVCAWLYSTLGCETLEKAATILGSEYLTCASR